MSEIIFVPTSHIARESLKNVGNTIEKEKPDCVAVELDINRYNAIKAKKAASFVEMLNYLDVFTFLLYWVLKKFQMFFGKITGILPGSEMVKAVEIAIKQDSNVAFIDQDIRITFLKIKNLALSEKLKFLRLLLGSVFYLFLPLGKKMKIDLNKVPEDEIVNYTMNFLKSELPGCYKILVDDRNRFMVNNLKKLADYYDKIVCVVGAAHKKGMEELLKM